MRDSAQKMRESYQDNKVIVFPAKSLSPWDNVNRFNFMETNLKDIVEKGVPYKRDRVIMKDPFVGQIN